MSDPIDRLKNELASQVERAKNINALLGTVVAMHEITSSMAQIATICNDEQAAIDLAEATNALASKLEAARQRNAAPLPGSPIH